MPDTQYNGTYFKQTSVSREGTLPCCCQPRKGPKSAIKFFGLKMTRPSLELFRKFIRFGDATHPLFVDMLICMMGQLT